MSVNFTRYQYRTFESTYLFKVKSEDKISLKILDLSQKCIFKGIFSTREISLPDTHQLLAEGNFTPFLEKLVERQLVPKEHFVSKTKEVMQKTYEKVLDQTIEQFKPKVFVERKEIEGFTCPLTLEIFQEPVIDEHGHTFEKSAIEAHLQRKNECPISRQSINSLAPNRLVQQTIEGWQNQDPIPNFSLFKKENPKLANPNLQMAQTFIEEGEYNEALEFYTKAFQYTKNDADYAPLPSLFEKMEEYGKATLAYLYLAKYQLQSGKLSEAIQTLEACQKGKSSSLANNLVLIELYQHSSQHQKALTLSIQTAATFSKQNPEQAITLYRRILQDHPTEFSLYSSLAALLELPQEKAQILLKGALEAVQKGDYKAAEKLIQEAESYSENSFVDGCVSLDLIKKQGNTPLIKQKLLYLARAFDKKGLTNQSLAAYKRLFRIERNPEYCQKILNAYQVLKKPQKEFEWSLTSIALLIEKKEWEQAEKLAKQTLQKITEAQKKTSLYEKLEKIYTQWNSHELQDLWPKLGKTYQESKQLALAEKTYRKAFERFHRFEEAIALAEILKESGKIQESVHTYYEAAVEALLEQNTNRITLCTREIKKIDPHLQHLDLNQRMHLLTQEHILKLSNELSAAHQEIATSNKKIASLEQTVQPLKEKAIQEEQERVRQVAVEKKMREELSGFYFGKAKWEKYFGDVGVEPPLPKDILEILKSPCPYWSGKRIEETHMLVLIPQSVNGRPLSLNMLQELIQSPKGGEHVTKYQYYYDVAQKEIGNQPISSSCWALITKDVLPNSRNKTYSEQQSLIKGPYTVPGALEIATGILMHHVQTGEKLYPDSPNTYTRCHEILSNGYRVLVGSFGSSGLSLGHDRDDGCRYGFYGMCGVRKFF